MGSSLQAACQCLQQLRLYQAYRGGDSAGIVGWHQSRANLVVTSGQGTLKIRGLGAKH